MNHTAYDMAAAWANDPERLAALLLRHMTAAQFGDVCGYLAKSFVALTDSAFSNEQYRREIDNNICHIHGQIVELIFEPVAEELIRQGGSASATAQAQRRGA